MNIQKKTWPEYFQKILDGEKTFDVRVADFTCTPGDILVLQEWDPQTKEYTGREIEKEITYVVPLKQFTFWKQEDLDTYGLQVMGLNNITPSISLDSIIFYTNDIETVKDFYLNTIHLILEYQQQDKYISFLITDTIRLGIKKAVEKREVPGSQSMMLASTSIDALYQEFQQNKIPFYKNLTDESWGKAFAILDPDGNKIEYIQRKETV